MGLLASLNREQKEALGLLQIGTFLEYFDLMLYIHMVVLLNDLFFPKSDPQTTALLTAFAFCSTYVMRPVGAFIFGWFGDNVGRKATIVWTTAMMSISCVIMANLPTYAQIGIGAAWAVTICRMAQGVSSMGEIIGAQIYMAESVPRPASYPTVALMNVASSVGTMVALGVSFLVTSFLLNWRVAFWIGAAIAFVGAAARTRLRETPEFLTLKRSQIKKGFAHEWPGSLIEKPIWKEPKKVKTLISCFFIYCGWPLVFYLSFAYFNPVLKESFGYSSAMIIRHNFFLSLISVVALISWAFLSYYIHPIKIIKTRGTLFFLLMLALPFLLIKVYNPLQLFILQSLILIFPIGSLPAEAVLLYHLPIWRRFTYGSVLHAFSRVLIYVFTSFGLVYFGYYFSHWGLWLVSLPITAAYLYGVLHFEELERQLGMFGSNNPFYKTELLKKSWFSKNAA